MEGLLVQRESQVAVVGDAPLKLECDRASVAGSVSQRACVFCGSRVVLYPIADAVHLVHGPIGCATYTWDIRGALSSGPELHRLSFSTDLKERDVIFGGERPLELSLRELIEKYNPSAAFVYSTCIVGLIGDDVEAICRKIAAEYAIPVIAVHSEGFNGTKRDGYKAACDALFKLIGTAPADDVPEKSLNILGDFNLAGEIWIIKNYYERLGVHVQASITGDGRIDAIRRAHGAALNVVQCSGSTMYLAKMMQERYGTPFLRVSYFGLEDMADALYDVAKFFDDPEMLRKARELVSDEISRIYPQLMKYREALRGKTAAIYVGGAFKAFSLVKALRTIGMEVVMVGSQTGNSEDYQQLKEICKPGTIIADDTNPLELSSFLKEKDIDLLIGGVKERPIAYKLGVGFCDHNHERKRPLEGFVGMLHFAEEVYSSVMSPVWQFAPRRERRSRLETIK